jgi:hypothetical protein
MVVPLWEIGRLQQLLSCKEMEINQHETQEWDKKLLEGLPILKQCRWPNAVMLNRARHAMAQGELAANLANTHESGNQKDSLVSR